MATCDWLKFNGLGQLQPIRHVHKCSHISAANMVDKCLRATFQRTIMSLEQTACEDLKAFERRLTEVVASLQPPTYRWRIILTVISACTAMGAWQWLADTLTYQVTFLQSLFNHPIFTLSSLILLSLFLAGIHKRVVAPSIITSRVRQVLQDFNMSCDNTGKLILKPRPTVT